MFMKGNREITDVQKQFVTKVKVLKLRGVKAFRGWKELCGAYNNVDATEVDFKNIVRDIKSYIGDYDAQILAAVFSADVISIKNYLLFGEVLSDATYGTNKYDILFVSFMGVDYHKRFITFGAALLADEGLECYTWLFNTFLEATGGHHPIIIITNQDKSMKSVIP
ncbi:protein FAR-RED ELONGATED HYPOCOTYL 3-like [Silene latifolia]|uniref:protein FAR-RED ELONGATED HYPOCOTYL 3-like n=1 Tax=Silene latifolia TaxID=37657 RepID=UPI003D7724FB